MGELCVSCESAGIDHAKNESWKWTIRSVVTKASGEHGSIFRADESAAVGKVTDVW